MDWSALRKEARSCESELETYIQSFARIATANENPTEPVDEEQGYLTQEESELARQIDVTINKFLGTTDKMAKLVAGTATKEQSAGIQRNREILNDFQTGFRKIQGNIVRKRESAMLFKRLHSSQNEAASHGLDPLLRERSGLQNAHKNIDSIIGQALETKDTLADQRRMIISSTSALGTIGTMFPGLNKLMSSIQFRKTRENAILAVVIASCICFTLWYLFG